MAQFIRHIRAIGIHDRFDLELEFTDGVNIVYGHNGTGKTTLLHILTNAVNLDFQRFVHLRFSEIEIDLDDSTNILIQRTASDELVSGSPLLSIMLDNIPIGPFPIREFLRKTKKESLVFEELRQQLLAFRKQKDYKLEVTYFPAFRTMIEAWSSVEDEEFLRRAKYFSEIERGGQEYYYAQRLHRGRERTATVFARRLFGPFVPVLDYPSPIEIEHNLNIEIQDGINRVLRTDQILLSDAFVKAFSAISHRTEGKDEGSDSDEILSNIARLTEELQNSPIQLSEGTSETVYTRLRQQLSSFRLDPEEQDIAKRVLTIYERSLKNRLDEQTSAFIAVESYVESVNQFLEDKKLVIEPYEKRNKPEIGVKFPDGRITGLETLSSGERQIVGLIYAASHIRGRNNIVLIDEPEISLHIDWQQDLIEAMVKQMPAKQLIVCTHSPIIGAEYDEDMIEAKLTPTEKAIDQEQFDFLDIDEDDITFS